VIECPIPCNLCGGSEVDVIGQLDRNGYPLRTTICRGCGMVWSNPRPAEQQVRRYYSAEYRLEYKGRSSPSMRHVARSGRGALDRYRTLASYLSPGDRILDVGAGSGEVVYVLRQLGFDAAGLEPNEEYALHAREALAVPVTTGFVQDMPFSRGSFNVVTMYHALEHVEDPSDVLSRVRRWLTEDGLLLIEVPNVESRCIAPWHRFHFAHFYNFNRATLEGLGRKTGFEPLQTTASADGGNLISIFRAATPSARTMIDPRNHARVTEAMKRHTAAAYYFSASPYAAPVGRLRAYLVDRLAVRGCTTPKQVLDKLIAAQLELQPADGR
jgi:2-polyprenyl-3-methyl-5-hydroxy-6-metoxy-1,4-benzoquinol methylase